MSDLFKKTITGSLLLFTLSAPSVSVVFADSTKKDGEAALEKAAHYANPTGPTSRIRIREEAVYLPTGTVSPTKPASPLFTIRQGLSFDDALTIPLDASFSSLQPAANPTPNQDEGKSLSVTLPHDTATPTAQDVDPPPLQSAPLSPHPVDTKVANVSNEVNVLGEFTHTGWTKAHEITSPTMPLASALISLFYPILLAPVELNSQPDLLERMVSLSPTMTRKEAIDSISSQLNLQIKHLANIVTIEEMVNVVPTNAPTSMAVSAINSAVDTSVVTMASSTPSEPSLNSAPVETASLTGWSLHLGEMLSESLERYAKSQKIHVIWDSDVDYKIAFPFSIDEGETLRTIQAVFALYEDASMPLQHIWYSRQQLLIVKDASL